MCLVFTTLGMERTTAKALQDATVILAPSVAGSIRIQTSITGYNINFCVANVDSLLAKFPDIRSILQNQSYKGNLLWTKQLSMYLVGAVNQTFSFQAMKAPFLEHPNSQTHTK